jgi:uncharacterized membrane protein YczE
VSVFIPVTRTELARRLPRLMPGLVICGLGFAAMIEADLGLGPWEVLHQGISKHTGVPIGTVGILVGLAVLAGWIPLRQRLGIGTVLNVVTIGIVIDLTMLAVPDLASLAAQWTFLLGGILLVGVGGGLYIGAGLGPGPRDGLMTGIAGRGWLSIRAARTMLEVAALTAGWLLDGTVGIGTVLFALGIGPLVQAFLARLSVDPPETTARSFPRVR